MDHSKYCLDNKICKTLELFYKLGVHPTFLNFNVFYYELHSFKFSKSKNLLLIDKALMWILWLRSLSLKINTNEEFLLNWNKFTTSYKYELNRKNLKQYLENDH